MRALPWRVPLLWTMMYFHRLRATRASSIALRTAGVRYCQRTPPPPGAGTRSFSASAPDFCTTIESSSSRLPKKNQPRFFLAVGAGASRSIAGVDAIWAFVDSGSGEGVGLDSTWACVAEGRALGLGGADLEAAGSGEVEWRDCRSGEAAGLGVGFGEGVGLATISIFWRLFKKRSRNRFSSSVCWVTP